MSYRIFFNYFRGKTPGTQLSLLIAHPIFYSDYTDDPEENLPPGDVNMEKLEGMYLSARRQSKRTRRVRRRVQEDGSILETTEFLAGDVDGVRENSDSFGWV